MRLFLAGSALLLAICACNKNNEPELSSRAKELVPIQLTKSQMEVRAAADDFTFRFLREASKMDEKNANIFISPFSMQMAFAMLGSGAEGVTKEEIYKAVGFGGFSTAEVAGFYKYLVPAIKDVDNATAVEIANSIWVQKGYPVLSSYTGMLKSDYHSEAHEIPANNPESAINRWCSDNTHGMIDKVIDQLDHSTRLMLFNALYFKGNWKDPFESGLNTVGKFTNSDGSKVDATFMNRSFSSYAYCDKEVAAVSFPYGNTAWNMTVLLPVGEVRIDDILAKLDADTWQKYVDGNGTYNVIAKFPKFSQKYSVPSCEKVMQNLGIQKAFTENAEFDGISKLPLMISWVLQKTAVEVDESGCRAAAITGIGMKESCAMPGQDNTLHFDMDSPFIYVIRERTSGTILFAGIRRNMN